MGKKDDEEKDDLTALEDIGHYLHQLNPEVEKKLEHGKKEEGAPSQPEETATVAAEPEPTPAPNELASDEFLSEPIETATSEAPPETTLETANVATEEFKTEEPQTETMELKDEEFKSEETPEPVAEPTTPEIAPEPTAEATPEPAAETSPEPTTEIAAEAAPEAETTPPAEAAPQTETPAPVEAAKPAEPPKEKPKAPEKFEEVKEFGKNISTTTAAIPGNPPFSIVLKNIQFKEDAENIFSSLKEYGIANASNESIFKQGLETGSILISQLSESTAILLVHKFRQYDLEIEMGLSEEIRPHKTRDQKGLVHKESLFQNKAESADLKPVVLDPKDLPLSTTPTLENFMINRYIGIVSEHALVEESEIEKTPWEEKYSYLAEQLKSKAIKLRGNAIVGVAFQLSPVDTSQYKITCTGNVVWVSPMAEKSV